MVGAALVVTTAAGLLGTTLASLEPSLSPGEAAADAQSRAAMVAMGWQMPRSAALRGLSAGLHETHGVEILHIRSDFELRLDDRELTGTAAEPSALAAATVRAVDELSLYPSGFLRASRLRRVALCTGLHENGRPIPSLPNYENTMLLDVGARPEFVRRLIHHEVFHFADLADDDQVLSDPAWEALNPAGFDYGHGGRDMRDPAASGLTEDRPGFLTRYATSALEEDKAEVFAFLMVRPHEVARRARQDGILAAKARRIRTIVQGLDPDMDQSFWARVARCRTD